MSTSTSPYKDKVVLITGGASGMGKSFLLHCLKEGALVSFCDINVPLSKSLWFEISSNSPSLASKVLFTKCDIRDVTQLRQFFMRSVEWAKRPADVLLAVAGVNIPDYILLPTSLRASSVPNLLSIDINLKGSINTLYTAISNTTWLVEGARICVIASTTGVFPSSVQPVYTASKHGLIGFCRAIAPSLEERGIKIFVLAPSPSHPAPPNDPSVPVAPSNRVSSADCREEIVEEDTFSKIIKATLTFLPLPSIIGILTYALTSSSLPTGSCIEIDPGNTSLRGNTDELPNVGKCVAWPEGNQRLRNMERKLAGALLPTYQDINFSNERFSKRDVSEVSSASSRVEAQSSHDSVKKIKTEIGVPDDLLSTRILSQTVDKAEKNDTANSRTSEKDRESEFIDYEQNEK